MQLTLGPLLWWDACVKIRVNILETGSCLLVPRAGQWSMLRQTVSLLGNVGFILSDNKTVRSLSGQNLSSSGLIIILHHRCLNPCSLFLPNQIFWFLPFAMTSVVTAGPLSAFISPGFCLVYSAFLLSSSCGFQSVIILLLFLLSFSAYLT